MAPNELHAHNDQRSPAGGAGNDAMLGPSTVPGLAKIDLGGVHSQRSFTGPRPCLRADPRLRAKQRRDKGPSCCCGADRQV